MPLTCPCCKASNEQPATCRRCKADLRLPWAVEEYRNALLAAARHALESAPADAYATIAEAARLRRTPDVEPRLAVAALLAGDYESALTHWITSRAAAP